MIVVLSYLVLDDNKKVQEIKIIDPVIKFPTPSEVIDEKKSLESYKLAEDLIKSKTYLDDLKASLQYRQSLIYKFNNNPAIGKLIYIYASVLPNSKHKEKDATYLFKLIEISKTKLLSDKDVAMGTALFYSEFGKNEAALKVLENYLRVSKPTVNFLNIYMNILVRDGEYGKAKKAYDKLSKIEEKSIDTYLALSNYLYTKSNSDSIIEQKPTDISAIVHIWHLIL